jgi:hypothetical protein
MAGISAFGNTTLYIVAQQSFVTLGGGMLKDFKNFSTDVKPLPLIAMRTVKRPFMYELLLTKLNFI